MSTQRSQWAKLALAVAVLAVPVLSGCEADVGPVAVGPAVGVGVEPGYYYDEEYVDVGGVYHPRDYWYHDGHDWGHRSGVPRGYAAHDRASVGYVHGSFHGGGGHR